MKTRTDQRTRADVARERVLDRPRTRLDQRIAERNLTAEELRERVNALRARPLHINQVYRWRAGLTVPNALDASLLARVLGCSVDGLFGPPR